MAASDVLARLGSGNAGLTEQVAATRLLEHGANVLSGHRAKPWPLLGRQLASPILILLFVTAAVSVFLGEATNAIIIGVILVASVGLGFVNEFRAERAADALHDQLRHSAIVVRDGRVGEIDVTGLVPGDIVHLAVGAVIPADLRLIDCDNLSCDESILTGESLPVAKASEAVHRGAAIGDLTSCLLMGTVLQTGTATAVVVTTGTATEFGHIATGLGERVPQTAFQRGLGRFSMLLLQVAVALTTLIFIANLLLGRPLLDSLLFSLAIAVGITPQLLPAVVSASLAAGSRSLAKRRILVKRLVCIEDLGDMDVLVTDKTGTLTEGRITFEAAVAVDPMSSVEDVRRLALLATDRPTAQEVGQVTSVGMNPLDAALWDASASARPDPAVRLAVLPFDHERRMTSALVELDGARMLVTKGSPEDVMRASSVIAPAAQERLDALYSTGSRVIAVASKAAGSRTDVASADESGLTLIGFLSFVDPPKPDARSALDRLTVLGISVKIATGDGARVAEKVLRDVGLPSSGTLTGSEVDALSDDELRSAAAITTIFARVSPEQKGRIVRSLRHTGRSVAFLGDGVNDALALHQADVGISVQSATDVARDAADLLLLDKDLDVLADGVSEGRRIFANTIKYVLMGSSSNFGNMFSAAAASVALPFLPMLPSQILLNNLLYDAGQLAIPGDRVDPEQLHAPSHWDIGYIRRFMLLFGPISSVFDFATFGLMLFVFHAGQSEFQAGWFIESIATQTLIIFAIRTRRVPFIRSRPSFVLLAASLGVVTLGVWLPYSPASGFLGFQPLPAPFFLALLGMVVAYLTLVEVAKAWFFSRAAQRSPAMSVRTRGASHRVHRRAARFTAPVSPRRPWA